MKSMPIYSKEVMENFMNPKNIGELENPDGTGRVGNPKCGDIMQVQIKIGKNKKGKKIIEDIKFKTFGCTAAIATSSMITQLAKGKTLDEAKKITKDDVAKQLHGLPPIKMHCSNLADSALRKAIVDYEKKK
jgi:nitrogen fixation NifU-like protein